MRIVRTVSEVRDALRGPRAGGERIGLVPTMGALHAGHVALLRSARQACGLVVASLFVNPSQFDQPADLELYPRDEAADAETASAAGVDLLFAPSVQELYPTGFDTTVEVGTLGSILEGAARPGHFRGVATVCTKLFAIVTPDVAYFGQKDAQQIAVVRRVVTDLNLTLDIVTVPTVRDPDGLALSSRNARLSPEERAAATALPRALAAGLDAHRTGGDPLAAARAVLAAEPHLTLDYVEVADFDGPTLVAAVRSGRTRLIDNVRLAPDEAALQS